MDERTLLVAINESPGEAGPRAAYADWLRERGDPRYAYFRAEHRLRTAPLGAATRRALGLAWRELRAAQDPAWLARVEPGAPIPAWVPIEARQPPRVGLDDWHGWASRSHYEWVVMAALAPIEAVVPVVIEARTGPDPDAALASGLWEREVPIGRGAPCESVADVVPFVQLKGHAWTIGMYDTFNLTDRSYRAAIADARTLSDRLGTLTVEYSAEDTSGATGYHLFECGELIEYAVDAAGETIFASKRRPPPWPAAPRDFPDDLFRALGLYIPGFYAGSAGVRLGVPDPDEFARADLLGLHMIRWEAGPSDVTSTYAEFAEIHRLNEPCEEGRAGSGGEDEEPDIPF